MKFRELAGRTVSAIGLGAMPVSMNNDKKIPSHADAVATVHAALDAGVTFIDTADCYAPSWDEMGHNELIVADALRTWSGDASAITVATKGGITRTEGEVWGRNGSLEYLRGAVEKSLRNLNVDVIDLYQYHRPDRWMVYGDVMSNLKTLLDEGLIRAVGISNASVEEIEIAQQVLGAGNLASVQNQFSPNHPGSIDELQFCGQHGIAFLPWSPLGGTGGGARSVGERFGVFQEVATAHSVSPQRVVLAWELALGEHVIPIPGARRAASIVDSAAAADLDLSDEEVARCSASVGIFPE
ncbi:aryl-alcohol dehydrogenase-like predicted oxidoreductase [Microbacterium endophyticum]|uniref:Aryl-alcohol dehydrogenase-like predicted oxidoreductase n=1 Tax=Microbacterium endophyticum TaxID=1526412 RepID=A0A7W4V2X3_9MICO|nr:aldo/keto reductase [Microbacterium endophyticum]MBB2975883.1 aryl-alcohol dehydrogenase-like predicted oxidoreductase [Microbacterium endophyticum]NIK36366.1 aryl-alcohol dehydrogenase-like predicted oxidoreductase [Microbacterium endophyticum]